MEGPRQHVVRPGTQLEILDGRRLVDVVPADQEDATGGIAAGHHIIDDRLPQAIGDHAQYLCAAVQVGGGQPFEPLPGDGGAEAVAHHNLLDLHLGAVGERGGLIQADALPLRPVLHVGPARVVVQIALHVAIHERLEAHPQRIFAQRSQGARLVAFRLGEQSPAGQVRARGDLQFGVDGHHRQPGLECPLDDFGPESHIAGALDDDVRMVDQIVDRVGQHIGGRKIGERGDAPARQHPADLQLWVMAQYQANQAVRDHSRARNTYSFSNCIVHHGIPSLLPKRALINKMAPVHTSGQAGGKRFFIPGCTT